MKSEHAANLALATKLAAGQVAGYRLGLTEADRKKLGLPPVRK